MFFNTGSVSRRKLRESLNFSLKKTLLTVKIEKININQVAIIKSILLLF